MRADIKILTSHIETLEDLHETAARSTACLHSPDSCRLQRDAFLARPALRTAIVQLKDRKVKLSHGQKLTNENLVPSIKYR